jgi:N-acyl-D-amino-acid deacylase
LLKIRDGASTSPIEVFIPENIMRALNVIRKTLVVAIVCLTGVTSCRKAPEPQFDLIIRNGNVVDGSGELWFPADVAVKGDTIVKVGRLDETELSAKHIIDARGLTVAPGFIDIHSHSDYSLLVDGTAQSKIRQGVTTEVLGEAPSAGPLKGKATKDLSHYGLKADWKTLGEYFARLQRSGMSVNVASYVGATQIRSCVLGDESRAPTAAETEEMKQLAAEAMRDGAMGLSSSLIVPPDTYLDTRQLTDLASAVKPFGGIYSTHMRSEGQAIFDAIREAITIGEQARMPEVIKLIEEAQAKGLHVTANQYPYVAGQNNLDALIPPWAMEGGREQMLARLGNPALRSRMEKDILNGLPGWFDHYLAMKGWESCVVAGVRSEKNKMHEGKSLEQISKALNKKPTDVVFDLLKDEGGSVPAVYFLMSEEDVRTALQTPWVSIGSDGTAVRPDGILGKGKPHPRWYGTFPRVLGKYVREEKVLALEEAVKKMTSLNAAKLGIEDRGLLKAGKKADITIFSAERVIDKATFENPHQYPEGIEYVIVNGALVIEKGQHLGSKPGRVLYGKGKK